MTRSDVEWRVRLLRDAGMSRPVARGVGGDLRYDINQLVQLLERGCPEQLALRIAAPDDAHHHDDEEVQDDRPDCNVHRKSASTRQFVRARS